MTTSLLSEYETIRLISGKSAPMGALNILFDYSAEEASLSGTPKETGETRLVRQINKDGDFTNTLLVSLGKPGKTNPENYRKSAGSAGNWLIKNKVHQACIDVTPILSAKVAGSLEALLEGLLLGSFQFNRYKTDHTGSFIPEITILGSETLETDQLIEKTLIVCNAVNLARDWGREPANVINPLTLAERALNACQQAGLKCTVFDENELAAMKAGGILDVGKGSQAPPRLIVIEYPGTDQSMIDKPVVLVGKALTFDTGGYSLKDLTQIQGMKYDKSGGMVVLAVLLAAASLKLKQPIVGIIGAAENMISGGSYRPDDILTMMSGKTVEIITTDAEGRLVLADCLTYAQNHYDPVALIDLATLTGGVVIALGRVRAGMMSNSDELANLLSGAGETVFERLWRLPLDEEYSKNIRSDEADIKNSGGKEGHPVYGGVFLKEFINEKTAWAHLDIAGVADTPKDLAYCPKGTTGFGVRLLLHYLQNL